MTDDDRLRDALRELTDAFPVGEPPDLHGVRTTAGAGRAYAPRWAVWTAAAALVVASFAGIVLLSQASDDDGVVANATQPGPGPTAGRSTPRTGGPSTAAVPATTDGTDGPSTAGQDVEEPVSTCTLGERQLRDALATSEQGGFAFAGVVTSVERYVEPAPADSVTEATDGPLTGRGPVPWVTFDVQRWYTTDWGTTFSVFMPGLDPQAGQTWRVAGNAYYVYNELFDGQSGEASPCTTGPDDAAGRAIFDDVYGGSVEPGALVPLGEPDPEVVDELRAARRAWDAAEPDAYSMVLGGYSTDTSSPFNAGCEPGRVVVIDGAATESVGTYGACVNDPATIPTVDELFDAAIRLAGAESFDYSVDPTGPSPLSFSAIDRSVEMSVTVSSVSDDVHPAVVGWQDVRSAAAQARERWDRGIGSGAYRLAIDTGGGERIAHDVRATIVDDRPTELRVNGEPADRSSLELPYQPNAVDHVFDLIDELRGQGNVVAVFDATTGVPTDVWFNPIVNGVDDELEVHVTVEPL